MKVIYDIVENLGDGCTWWATSHIILFDDATAAGVFLIDLQERYPERIFSIEERILYSANEIDASLFNKVAEEIDT